MNSRLTTSNRTNREHKINWLSALFVFLLLITFGFSSCELDEINVNPNQPQEVPLKLLLPPALESTGRAMISEISPIAGIFMQYYVGSRHYEPMNRYVVDHSFYIQDVWQDFYTSPLLSFQLIIQQAEEENAPHYAGIGRIMMAYSLATISSCWGDVPYSEAFKASEGLLKPKYDSQSVLYSQLFEMLDQAIIDLQQSESVFRPSSDDLIYQGNLNLWIKAAHGLKAKYALHLTKRSSELSFNPFETALNEALLSIGSNEEDFDYRFGYSAAEPNLYTTGKNYTDLVPHNTLSTIVKFSDPRKNQLYRKQFGLMAAGDYYSKENPDVPVSFLSYSELKFIEAEARLRLDENDPLALTAFQEAVRANIKKFTLKDESITDEDIDNYISSYVDLSGNFEEKLEQLMTEKYISMFSRLESWVDFRRTGYPVLPAVEGANHPQNPNGEVPRRFPYPQNELLHNGANVPSMVDDLQDRFWWDID